MIGHILVLGFLSLLPFALGNEDLPELILPWGKWQATIHPNDSNIYLFKNVRFGAPPERFGAPAFPTSPDSIGQDTPEGISCVQVKSGSQRSFPDGMPPHMPAESREEKQTEDCLFLDVYAPTAAFKPGAKPLPVVVWIYGGGFAYGSKNPIGPINSGRSILNASDYELIFVVGNYRVGAFGWLAGDYMQRFGQPNAGLYDQALLFKWVQDYAGLVQGDVNNVSAWGESAGAGSILHHLIRKGGEKDPGFTRFAVQSPAFQWAWNNSHNGTLDNVYRKFSLHAGCKYDYNITCLRVADSKRLEKANQDLFDDAKKLGLLPFGPAVDDSWIKTIPTISFFHGNYWKSIESALISHCTNEAYSFIPGWVNNQTAFDLFLELFLPGPALEPEREAIKNQYPCKGNFSNCIGDIIRDAFFTCNTRNLFDSYPENSYMMEYGFPWNAAGYHATDLIPLFVNNVDETIDLLKNLLDECAAKFYAGLLWGRVVGIYQSYFASFALTGNPRGRQPPPSLPTWVAADGQLDKLSNVMKVSGIDFHAFANVSDNQNTNYTCSFWESIAEEIIST
ncbi:carboxylesterase family protein [Jackrogersella minutella]|nr:carboxylesterase family protein [Jackrogersella minutella]